MTHWEAKKERTRERRDGVGHVDRLPSASRNCSLQTTGRLHWVEKLINEGDASLLCPHTEHGERYKKEETLGADRETTQRKRAEGPERVRDRWIWRCGVKL